MTNSRLVTRISLLLVLLMGLFGGWYASTNWQLEVQSIDVNAITQETDWVDVIAGIGEGAVQLVLGLTTE